MANPNPSRITDELWWFWEEFKKLEPSVLLGGIYANKPGYHNSRSGNSSGNYSVQLADDRLGPSDKAAAIDLTFPDAQSARYATIDKYSSRLLNSGKDMDDERGNYLREFYGQADSDDSVEGWDFQYLRTVTSDSSHLWHIHISFIRRYVDDKKAMRAVLSILKGESVETWRTKESNPEEEEEGMLSDEEIKKVARSVWTGLDIIENDGRNPNNPTWVPATVLTELIKGLTALSKTVEEMKAKLDALQPTVVDVKEAVKDALREGTE